MGTKGRLLSKTPRQTALFVFQSIPTAAVPFAATFIIRTYLLIFVGTDTPLPYTFASVLVAPPAMSGAPWAGVWQPSTLTYNPPNNPSRNLQALFAYVAARNAWHISGPADFLALFDESLEHRILPQSLAKPVLNKRQYAELISGLLRFIKSYKVRLQVRAGEPLIGTNQPILI